MCYIESMKGGLLVKEARRRAGLTQSELAGRLGTSQSVVARWESNARSLGLETVTRAVRACGFDLNVSMPIHDDQDLAQTAQNVQLTHERRLDGLINMFDVEEWSRGVRFANERG
jgi:transcriptional regulator with XRE-family HTH domain